MYSEGWKIPHTFPETFQKPSMRAVAWEFPKSKINKLKKQNIFQDLNQD